MSDTLKQSTNSELIAAANVEGVEVFDALGDKLGTIKDVYINKRSGQAEFVSLAFGGVMGLGEKHHPVPWSALEYDSELGGFLVGVDKAALSGGPVFADAQLSGPDKGWTEQVRSYFGGLPAAAQAKGGRHFTHGTSASTADMAVLGEVRHHDKGMDTPHTRPIETPLAAHEKTDHLAEKVERSESRQEALLDEAIEESFPASDPVSAKHIT